MDSSLLCSICLRELAADSTTVVYEKGLQTLIKKSQEKGDDKWKQWIGKQNYTFHLNCRKRYAVSSSRRETQSVKKPNTMSLPISSKIVSTLQSAAVVIPSSPSASGSSTSFSEFQNDFQFDKLCFICGNVWDKRKPGSIVSENRIKDRLIAAAREHDNSFGAPIIARLQSIESIVASKARYHTACYRKLILLLYKKPSCPKIKETDIIFQRIYEHIESSGEFKFHLSTLQALMGDEENNQICTRTLFRHLKKKYADDIFIFQHKGKEPLIYYKYHNMAQICRDWYGVSESLSESAKRTILQVCAEILQDEIKKFQYNTTTYPAPQAFLDTVASDIPPLLNSFLHRLIITNRKEQSNESSLYIKIENLAHSIISALRPKSFISCLQLSLGTYIYRKTRSKLAISLLNRLGVCSSYHNIQLHEASTIIHPQETKIEDAFVQYVFDNTNHNASTLDGRETNIIPDTPYDSNCAI
ncbi:uncharacterized protein [Chelonus insularis]|uniref:uncharacterized protein n=1 Tax=Chelonus insularis TaxID=460826 RepID=UPI001588DDC4|nr:uncharacterized protein LOC118067061 [Chelonus insularis]XP_034939490.1 uncharacterized protein LOC118067061 [Chelonus insularis]